MREHLPWLCWRQPRWSTGVGWTAIAGLVVAATVVAARWSADRKARRRSNYFTPGEVDLVLDHRRAISFDDWNALPADGQPEERVMALDAARWAERLTATPGWDSDELAAFRLQRDPLEEARYLQVSARDVDDQRRALAAERGRFSPGLDRWDEHLSEWADQIDALWRAVQDRSAAFTGYAERLLQVAAVVEQDRAARELRADVDRKAPVLLTRTVTHEMAGADLRALADELDLLSIRLNPRSELSPPAEP